MTKSEYVRGMILFRREREDYENRVRKFKAEWIEDHKMFSKGDRVIYNGHKYQVYKMDSNVAGQVIYILRRILSHGELSHVLARETDVSTMLPVKREPGKPF